jgi:hypothetical protein
VGEGDATAEESSGARIFDRAVDGPAEGAAAAGAVAGSAATEGGIGLDAAWVTVTAERERVRVRAAVEVRG